MVRFSGGGWGRIAGVMRGVLLILGLVLVLAEARGADEWWLGAFRGRALVEDRNYERVVEVTVAKAKEGDAVLLSGGYWFTDGVALAPDFEGTLVASDKGTARFTFRDSFANEGKLTLARDGNGVILKITVSQVRNARAASLYEAVRMRRF